MTIRKRDGTVGLIPFVEFVVELVIFSRPIPMMGRRSEVAGATHIHFPAQVAAFLLSYKVDPARVLSHD